MRDGGLSQWPLQGTVTVALCTAVTREGNVNKTVPVGDDRYKNSQKAHKNEEYKPFNITPLKSHVYESMN